MNVVDTIPEPSRRGPGSVRRYVRVRRKGSVSLDVGGDAIDVCGFTTSGVVTRRAPSRSVRDGMLVFRFDGFEVSRDIAVNEVKRFEDVVEHRDLIEIVVGTDQQLGAIIVASLRNADVLAGDLLREAASRPNGLPKAVVPARARRRRETNRALAAAIMVCAIAACAWTGYQRLFVVDGYGFLTAGAVDPIRAEEAGTYYSYGASSNRPMYHGELIGLIDPRRGKPVSITSPCDCYLGDPAVPSGSPVQKGAVVARVIPADARVEVTARMPLSELWAVSVGDMVDLQIPDSEAPVPGRVTRIERDKLAAVGAVNDGATTGTLGIVHIEPETEIGRSLVGLEVPIRIVRASRMVAQLITK